MIGLDEDPAAMDRRRDVGNSTSGRTIIGGTGRSGSRTSPKSDGTLSRCAMTVHLLAHSPNNAVVAAVTTSLPERIGGGRNYDYRYTWVRDASLSAAFLAQPWATTARSAKYFSWLSELGLRRPIPHCRSATAPTGRR